MTNVFIKNFGKRCKRLLHLHCMQDTMARCASRRQLESTAWDKVPDGSKLTFTLTKIQGSVAKYLRCGGVVKG